MDKKRLLRRMRADIHQIVAGVKAEGKLWQDDTVKVTMSDDPKSEELPFKETLGALSDDKFPEDAAPPPNAIAARERSLMADLSGREPPLPDDLGLSIDMLDVDRLRQWAEKLLIHGPDISHWGSVPFVVSKLQTIATGMEKAIRDIGELRKLDGPAGGARGEAGARERDAGSLQSTGAFQPTQNEAGDWVCQHGTAVDVHCCNCHSGFMFDADACVCGQTLPDVVDALRQAAKFVHDASDSLPRGEVLQLIAVAEEEAETASDWHRNYESCNRERRQLADRLASVTRLVAGLQAHAKEHGWQDVDEPIAALLTWSAEPGRARETAPPIAQVIAEWRKEADEFEVGCGPNARSRMLRICADRLLAAAPPAQEPRP